MGKSLEFFFDLMSPFSYLAATQLQGLCDRTGATVQWKPLYLPGVMKATGNLGPTAVLAKAVHTFKDLNDWARHYGLPEIWLPDNFPFTAVLGDRLCLVAEEQGKGVVFATAMFRRIWAERLDANDPAVLASALTEVGLEPASAIARAGHEELKARLKANTDDAIARGAYGVPTFFVGDEMFVGNDRLAFVERALKVAA